MSRVLITKIRYLEIFFKCKKLLPIFAFSYEEQSLDVDRLYPHILPTIITDKHASDQTDGVCTTTTAGVEMNEDETDSANQANVSEAPASALGGQV